MPNIKDICDAIGRKTLREKLRLESKSSISNAIAAQKFPSDWYRVVKAECESVGLECPMSMFNFKSPSPNASNRATDQ